MQKEMLPNESRQKMSKNAKLFVLGETFDFLGGFFSNSPGSTTLKPTCHLGSHFSMLVMVGAVCHGWSPGSDGRILTGLTGRLKQSRSQL